MSTRYKETWTVSYGSLRIIFDDANPSPDLIVFTIEYDDVEMFEHLAPFKLYMSPAKGENLLHTQGVPFSRDGELLQTSSIYTHIMDDLFDYFRDNIVGSIIYESECGFILYLKEPTTERLPTLKHKRVAQTETAMVVASAVLGSQWCNTKAG